MKRLLAILAIATIPAFADEGSRKAKAADLLEAMNMAQVQDQMLATVKRMALAQLPKEGGSEAAGQAVQDATAQMLDLIGWDSMKADYARIYAESFTDEELDGIVAFYRSPAGKSMMSKMPVLMEKAMVLAQERMKDIQPEIERITSEAMLKSGAAK
jgi:hypothetical protein